MDTQVEDSQVRVEDTQLEDTQIEDTQVEDTLHDSASSTADPESGDVSERQKDSLDSEEWTGVVVKLHSVLDLPASDAPEDESSKPAPREEPEETPQVKEPQEEVNVKEPQEEVNVKEPQEEVKPTDTANGEGPEVKVEEVCLDSEDEKATSKGVHKELSHLSNVLYDHVYCIFPH